MSSSTVNASEADSDPFFYRDIASPGRVGWTDLEAANAAVTRLRVAAKARAVAEAELAAAAVGVADLCTDRNYDSLEVASVLTWTPRFACSEVGWCRSLMEQLPAVFGAWQAGRIDRHKAYVFGDCLDTLFQQGSDEAADAARRIAGAVLPDAPRWTASRLRARLLRLILRVDPAAARRRVEQTIADRDVWLSPAEDGATACVSGFNLPVARAAAAFERVDAIARARRAGGDARTVAQLRADTMLDLLDGTGAADLPAPIGRPGVLELQIPLATAIGADSAPGELAGYGPVLADVARQIAAQRGDAQWRFSVTYRGELVYQGITRARPTGISAPTEPPDGGAGGRDGIDPRPSPDPADDRLEGEPAHRHPVPGGCRRSETDPSTARCRGKTPDGAGRTAVGADTPPATACAVDGAAAGTTDEPSSGLVDCLTGVPITAVHEHVPHPPVEPDPRRRFPGEKLKRWIAARDRTCRAPGCTAPARVCEYDHTTDYADGGLTTADDLELLCKAHHPVKHDGWWTVLQIAPGRILWVTPHGHVYRQPPG